MGASPRLLTTEAHAGRTLASEFWYYAKAGLAFIYSEELQNQDVGDTVSTLDVTV